MPGSNLTVNWEIEDRWLVTERARERALDGVRALSLSSSICASSSSARSYARSAMREGQILELRVKVYGWKARLCALERMEGVRMAGVYCVLGHFVLIQYI